MDLQTQLSYGHGEGEDYGVGASGSTPADKERRKRERNCEIWSNIILILAISSCLIISVSLIFLGVIADKEWNSILKGADPFPQVYVSTGRSSLRSNFSGKRLHDIFHIFKNGTKNKGSSDLKALLHRPLGLDVLFAVFILLSFAPILYHFSLFFISGEVHGGIRRLDKTARKRMVIIYTTVGMLLLCGVAGSSTSTTWNQDNQAQTLDKLYQDNAKTFANKTQNYSSTPFDLLDKVLLLMDIIGICASSSLHQALEPRINYPIPLLQEIKMAGGGLYTAETFSDLRFCQLEMYKGVAVIFALLAILLCFALACMMAYRMRNVLLAEILRRKEKEEDEQIIKELGLEASDPVTQESQGQGQVVDGSVTESRQDVPQTMKTTPLEVNSGTSSNSTVTP